MLSSVIIGTNHQRRLIHTNISLYARGILPSPDKVQTKAIQALIDECAATGGGSVEFGAGIYRTGTLYLRSNTYLHLPFGCTLKGSDDESDYNEPYAWPQNPVSVNERTNGKHLIVILEVENCGIYGGGRIDGNGAHFGFRNEEGFKRPAQMVYMCESSNIRLRDLELVNSTYWSCFVHGCEDVFISGLKIKNNQHVKNGDGIDIDSSRRVIVSDCNIDSEDDCMTFRNDAKRLKDKTRILEDVTVTNCRLRTNHANAFRIGVGNGAIRNCTVSNIVIRDSSKGVCLEARYNFNTDEKPGTRIENISFSNIYMECRCPVFLASHCKGISACVAPQIRNIRFMGLTVKAEHNVVVQGNEGAVCENIGFFDSIFDFSGRTVTVDAYSYDKQKKEALTCIDKYGYSEWDYVTSSAGFYIANAAHITLSNVQVNISSSDAPMNCGAIITDSDVQLSDFTVFKGGKPAEATICKNRP